MNSDEPMTTPSGKQFPLPTKIDLNVGGTKYATSLSTLTRSQPNSMLAAMFSGRHNIEIDNEGAVFIDRDGPSFAYVLSYLRNAASIGDRLPRERHVLHQLLKEADYYQLPEMKVAVYAAINCMEKERITKAWVFNPKRVVTTPIDAAFLDLRDVNFGKAVFLHKFCLHECDAEGVSFQDSVFESEVTFSSTNLTKANFRKCKFKRRVVFSGSTNLDEVIFSSCVFNEGKDIEKSCSQQDIIWNDYSNVY
ncbi:uncharacterized protein [Oscarella lobularis]|uniref:uncharacterized protein n=1 Tax=Oscarella lobularis TaxID=121494 RepID=UPI003313AA9E